MRSGPWAPEQVRRRRPSALRRAAQFWRHFGPAFNPPRVAPERKIQFLMSRARESILHPGRESFASREVARRAAWQALAEVCRAVNSGRAGRPWEITSDGKYRLRFFFPSISSDFFSTFPVDIRLQELKFSRRKCEKRTIFPLTLAAPIFIISALKIVSSL